MRHLFALPFLLAPLLGAGPAVAAPVSENFAITASGFSDVSGLGAVVPADPVSFVVSLMFDPASGDQFASTAGLRVLASTLPVASLSFNYDSASDTLVFGGAGLAGIGITAGTNDLLAAVTTPYTGRAGFGGLIYTAAGSPGVFESFTGTVSVPEPASVMLMLGGIVGLAVRRRRA